MQHDEYYSHSWRYKIHSTMFIKHIHDNLHEFNNLIGCCILLQRFFLCFNVVLSLAWFKLRKLSFQVFQYRIIKGFNLGETDSTKGRDTADNPSADSPTPSTSSILHYLSIKTYSIDKSTFFSFSFLKGNTYFFFFPFADNIMSKTKCPFWPSLNIIFEHLLQSKKNIALLNTSVNLLKSV